MSAKKAKAVTDWESATESSSEWESLPSGLSPLWKPKEGDTIIFQPDAVHQFKETKKNKKKKGAKANFAIEGVLLGGTFNAVQGTVKVGDRCTLGSVYNFIGEDRLITEQGELSPMSIKLKKANAGFKIRFDGKISIGGGRTVNQMDIAVPKGFR
jgi:hypothetical protein